jgi:catechol 2,3-dioxygenase-like lactoylglutathione lyase family enzyme
MGMIKPGPMHRLAVAVENAHDAPAWFARVFGFAEVGAAVVPFTPERSTMADEIRQLEGSENTMSWHGGLPLLFLAPFGEDGYVHQHLRRWGSGIHSLAWEVEDMWAPAERLRARELRITGINIPGRHFFVHPRDTHGLMVEFTDTYWANDPRRGGSRPELSAGVIEDVTVAWVTAVVEDATATAHLFEDLVGATPVSDKPRPTSTDEVADVEVGDLTLRLVTPGSGDSRFAGVLERGPRLYSYALAVPDLDAAASALEAEGAVVAGRADGVVWVDPASTFGIPLELTQG